MNNGFASCLFYDKTEALLKRIYSEELLSPWGMLITSREGIMKVLNWLEFFFDGIQHIASVPRNVRGINLLELESLVYLDISVTASSNRLRVQVCPLHMFLHINCVSTSIFEHGVEAGIHEVSPTSGYRTGMKDWHFEIISLLPPNLITSSPCSSTWRQALQA